MESNKNVPVGEVERAGRGALGALRRLRLQEGLLAAALGGALDNPQLRSRVRALADKRNKEFNELNNSFCMVNSLFEKLKYSVTSEDCVRKTDIAEYKKIVMELEDRITFFKKFLNKLMNELREAETILSSEIKDIERNMTELNTKLIVKPYTAMTSSVKALRNTPSACSEVQRFQTYLKENGGHRGGWGDQEHFLFVKYRQKYTKRGKDDAVDGDGTETPYIQLLIKALTKKIPGMTAEEVVKHDKWYTVYACLKCEQQDQLDKWKAERRLVKQQFELPQDDMNGKTRFCRKYKESFNLESLQREARMLVQNIQEVKQHVAKDKKEEVEYGSYYGDRNLVLEASFLQENIMHLNYENKSERIDDCNEVSKDSRPQEASVLKIDKQIVARNQNSPTVEQASNQFVRYPFRQVERQCRLNNNVLDSYKNKTINNKEMQLHLRPGTKMLSKKSLNAKDKVGNKDEISTDESAHYLVPTKQWSMRSVRSSSGSSSDVRSRDFRLNIPMANSPKLGISNWRRCLIGEN